ncbi:o-methyltransferase family 3 [Moniliophthora roreri MCA 2997]|uniref:O-methyltransferase family 3 n=1 Tax=Moniliophthora roreri (strain MCA 2997) TaxID=1381753 RepID=V2XQJ8_MONRO|nr:o-methyltransferase family 3 [Moniliophthora roreri MCA 2997]
MPHGQPFQITTIDDWVRSDRYHNSFLLPEDGVLENALKRSHENEFPDIAVSAAQGRFLNLLAKSIGVKRILEVGTLGGYSTIWLGRALPEDGELITLELEEKYAQVAIANLAHAGLSDKCKVLVGPAYDSMVKLDSDKPFDFIFIDADKPSNLKYFLEAKRLVRKGGVIIVDNMVRYGRVADPEQSDDKIEGIRSLLRALKGDGEVETTTIATVGDKGYDGFLYAVKL